MFCTIALIIYFSDGGTAFRGHYCHPSDCENAGRYEMSIQRGAVSYRCHDERRR